MKPATWAFMGLILMCGIGLLINNSQITGNTIAQDELTLCKNTLDCPQGTQCCYFKSAHGGFCGSPQQCAAVTEISETTKDFGIIVEQAGAHLFFSPFNGILLVGLVTGLLGVVHTVKTE